MGVSPYRLAVDSISKFALRDEWQDRCVKVTDEHLSGVLETFDLDPDELPERLGGTYPALLDFVLEDFMTREFKPGAKNVVEDYLARRGWRESAPGKQYLQALRHSAVSVYEVTETVPGSHFLAKDLVRGGEPVAVFDKLGSQSVIRWDRIAARLLRLGGKVGMSGGTLPIPFEDAGDLLDRIAKLKTTLENESARPEIRQAFARAGAPASWTDDEMLTAVAPLVTAAWLSGILRRQSRAGRPKLINTDREEIVFATTRFPVADAGQAGEIERRLERLRDVYRDDAPEPTWTWFTGKRPAARTPGGSTEEDTLTLISEDPMHQTVLGSIRLESGVLLLETNSAARAERGRAMLAEALQGLVGAPLTVTRSVDQALKENAKRSPKIPEPEPFSPAEVEAIKGEFLARHYRDVLSQPLPMLDGKTPRQAARTKRGRERVAEWLKYLENQSARQPDTEGLDLDFGWMWEELKISGLRQ